MYRPHFFFLFICQWTFGLFLHVGYCEYCCKVHGGADKEIKCFLISPHQWEGPVGEMTREEAPYKLHRKEWVLSMLLRKRYNLVGEKKRKKG